MKLENANPLHLLPIHSDALNVSLLPEVSFWLDDRSWIRRKLKPTHLRSWSEVGSGSPQPREFSFEERSMLADAIQAARIDRNNNHIDQEVWDWKPPLLRAVLENSRVSEQALSAFDRLISHRREQANHHEVVVCQNRDSAGYTLIHIRTGITVTFLFQSSGGFGQVLAKSYSNINKPNEVGDQQPTEFYGYGVARRLYRAGGDLLPNIRWFDNAMRDTSRALRSFLHRQDPYRWEDKRCLDCQLGWRELTSRIQANAQHLAG